MHGPSELLTSKKRPRRQSKKIQERWDITRVTRIASYSHISAGPRGYGAGWGGGGHQQQLLHVGDLGAKRTKQQGIFCREEVLAEALRIMGHHLSEGSATVVRDLLRGLFIQSS